MVQSYLEAFMAQLRMVFNAAEKSLPELALPEGFSLINILPENLAEYNALRQTVGFSQWGPEAMAKYHNTKVIKTGHLVIAENATGKYAASAAAEISRFEEYPQIGELGWVMTSPEFQGKHLGSIVSTAAMHTLYRAGYRVFYLLTDDFRQAALKTYLKLGWQPWLYADDMQERWHIIANGFGMKFEDLNALPEKPDFPAKANS